MEEIIIQPKNEGQQNALLTILKGFGIPFEQRASDETEKILANKYLTEKINRGRKDSEEGKGISIPINDLWK